MADLEMDDAPVPADTQSAGYFTNVLSESELDEKYPDRPKNTKPTPPFHALYIDLFEPLLANKQMKTGIGGRGTKTLKPHEVRRQIIDRFIAKWRAEVGPDIYPAFRLIMPDKDRDRTVYGLKEKNIGKILVKVMKIDKNSDDGNAMINWKLPGQRSTGDFAGRCYEIIKKRPMRTKPGDMSIARVNELLDELAGATKEDVQLPILTEFYNNMNPEELMWLVRIILKQMKVGATERTFFDAWHPDAEHLFNVSSQMKRVCWELWDPTFRLGGDDLDINLMSCFQPQLAQFQKRSLETVVKSMRLENENDKFWIEEKLDGERMQLHMHNDEFKFWSRKAKDYTYLYGNDYDSGSLTQFLKKAFHPKVKSLILDGEMITWDPKLDTIVGFGTLKTAAIEQARNPEDGECNRPLFKVFDILYLNGKCLTKAKLEDRRNALEASVFNVDRRLEIHGKTEATTVEEIETQLRQIVAEGSEGLVIKNPRSMYRLNDRNDDWIKVKPEYMTEFGEELDCLVVGGYYGSGRRGGILSSYLCGLRVDGEFGPDGGPKFWSFFKVGGGFTASDYKHIQHITEDKWIKWDENPPRGTIELAGNGRREFEKPDVWIKPRDSFVVSVKAAQVTATDQFKMGKTLRFPRFKEFKKDKDWSTALSIAGFIELKAEIDMDLTRKLDVEHRKRQTAKRRKKDVIILGQDEKVTEPYAGPKTNLFEGWSFYVLTESSTPPKKSVAEIEQLIKSNGGRTYKSENAVDGIRIIGDRNVVKVAALKRKGTYDIIRPSWLFACISHHEAEQALGNPGGYTLPLEPHDLFFATEDTARRVAKTVDTYGDSYTRDVTPDGLLKLLDSIDDEDVDTRDSDKVKDELLEEHELLFEDLSGWIFADSCVYFDYARLAAKNKLPESTEASEIDKVASQRNLEMAELLVRFGDGIVADNVRDGDVTQVVLGSDTGRVRTIREIISERKKVPRLVDVQWVEQSVEARSLLDEARFPIVHAVAGNA